MKRFLIIAMAAATISVAANAQTIRQRPAIQQARVAQGVRSGELTRHETAAIERNEASLRRQIVRDTHDGRGLTPVERTRIRTHENQLSHQIYRTKHNGRTR